MLLTKDAGHFLPALANTIHQKNKQDPRHSIPLKSVIIGNGLTDPLTQYQYFKPMACNNPSYGNLITSSEKCQELESHQKQCKSAISNCYKQTDFSSKMISPSSINTCKVAASICNINVVKAVIDDTKQNIYDIRKKCEGKNNLFINFYISINALCHKMVPCAMIISLLSKIISICQQ